MQIRSASFKRLTNGVGISTNGGPVVATGGKFNTIAATSNTVVCVHTDEWNGVLDVSKPITVNDVLFAGNAEQLAAKLRDEVFIAEGGSFSSNYLIP